ncbi:hypothetical protein [Geobacter sp. OR-1]|uniref:hypothetical protein n=1 Tax=Geobacter sp. OR-1 TaxID=1266765 RepID=UPI0005A6B677|nr:hypothetical protein [Geobacter sp. OR-1]
MFLLVFSTVPGLECKSYGFVPPAELQAFPMIKINNKSVTLSNDGKLLIEVTLDNSIWSAPTDEIAFHSATVAYVVYKAIPFAFSTPMKIQISKWDHPRILFNRGPNNEYLVLLGDSNQAPYIAFGFGQELGHALIDNLNGSADPQLWFEETFCEALAVWALQQLALEWGKSKDGNLKFYAQMFSSEAKNLHYNTKPPSEGYPLWFAKNRKFLTEKCNDRELENEGHFPYFHFFKGGRLAAFIISEQ